MTKPNQPLDWYRVADVDELPAGRVKTVTAGTHSMALTHVDGDFTAMDNRCPYQGFPGEALMLQAEHHTIRDAEIRR